MQEAQELARTVQQVMEVQKFGIDSVSRVAVLRDRVSKVVPARILFQQLLAPRGQIILEVRLMSLDRSRSWQLGLDLPNTFRISALVDTMRLTNWSTGLFGLSFAAANILLKGTRSVATTLYETQLRTVDGQPVSFAYGTKYPITTLTYIGEVPPGEQAFIPPPSFNFEDLGLTLKVTPKVHSDQDVTLDLEASFKLLKGDSLNGIPVIVNREVKTQMRVPFAGAAVVAGLVNDTDIDSLSGPAGLLNIPVLGTVLGRRNLSKEHIEMLLVVRPRLLTLPVSEQTTQAIWLGPDTRPRLPL
jgi:type II secretory pathway component GspD/PulD (secretin)